MSQQFYTPEQLEDFTSMASEIGGILHTIQIKKNRNIMILKEWNQYSNSLDDVEEYIENLDLLNDIVEEDSFFESLSPIIQVLFVECIKFNDLTDFIVDGFTKDCLEKGFDLDFIEGIMEQMMIDVVSNEDWVIFDGIIESFMNIDVDSYEEVDEELLS